MTRLRTYAPMKRRSTNATKALPDVRAVYRLVDQRSEGRCEYCHTIIKNERPNALFRSFSARCPRHASDHHHLVKPRFAHHDPDLIVHLCRDHHDRCEWPYKRGRLVVTSLGGGRFTFAISYAADKFSSRGARDA